MIICVIIYYCAFWIFIVIPLLIVHLLFINYFISVFYNKYVNIGEYIYVSICMTKLATCKSHIIKHFDLCSTKHNSKLDIKQKKHFLTFDKPSNNIIHALVLLLFLKSYPSKCILSLCVVVNGLVTKIKFPYFMANMF